MKNKIVRYVVVFCCLILIICPVFSASALTFPGIVTFDNRLNIPFESVNFNSTYPFDAFTENYFEMGVNNVYNRNSNTYVNVASDLPDDIGLPDDIRLMSTVLAPDHAGTTFFRSSSILFSGLDNLDDGLYQVDLYVSVDIVSDGNNVHFDTGVNSTYGIFIDGMGVAYYCLIVFDDTDNVIFSLDENIYNNINNLFGLSYNDMPSTQYILSIRKPFYDDLIGGGDDGSYDEGYNVGYDDGYNRGSSESFGENLLGDTFNAPLEALNQWVLFETPGGLEVTMGGLFTAVIALAVLIIFLKMFAGG